MTNEESVSEVFYSVSLRRTDCNLKHEKSYREVWRIDPLMYEPINSAASVEVVKVTSPYKDERETYTVWYVLLKGKEDDVDSVFKEGRDLIKEHLYDINPDIIFGVGDYND